MIDYLSRRPRSVLEMRQYGKKIIGKYDVPEEKEAREEIIESLISKMIESSYLSDIDFTKWWIEQRTLGSKPKSLTVIRQELLLKGISGSVIQSTWAEIHLDEKELLERHVEKVIHKYNLEDQKDKRRFIQYLMRKGFPYEDIKSYLEANL